MHNIYTAHGHGRQSFKCVFLLLKRVVQSCMVLVSDALTLQLTSGTNGRRNHNLASQLQRFLTPIWRQMMPSIRPISMASFGLRKLSRSVSSWIFSKLCPVNST